MVFSDKGRYRREATDTAMFRIKVKQVININILPSPIKKIQFNKEKQNCATK